MAFRRRSFRRSRVGRTRFKRRGRRVSARRGIRIGYRM